MQGLSERIGEAELRVEQAEAWATEATEMLYSCLEQHQALQRKLTDLETQSRRNNLRIFGVAEGEEGNSVSQFIEGLRRRELPLPQDLDLKIQRAHRSPAFNPTETNNHQFPGVYYQGVGTERSVEEGENTAEQQDTVFRP